MEVIVTKIQNITGKDKRQWVKVDYISVADGEAGSIFSNLEEIEPYAKLFTTKCLTKEELAVFSKQVETIKVNFNNRGRFVGVEE